MHNEELIELYALGTLEPEERAAVEEHIAQCESCRVRFVEAVSVVAAMTGTQPEDSVESVRTADPRVARFAALAAVFALLFAGALAYAVLERTRSSEQSVPLAAIVGSHFLHAQFQSAMPQAPAAKVLYARDGSWIYVIVNAPASYALSGIRDGHATDLASTSATGTESTAFVRTAQRYSVLELRVGGALVARAPLVYDSAGVQGRPHP